VPGSIGRVTAMHGVYYAEHWGFGPQFEAKVATELSEFITRYDAVRDGFWLAWLDGRIVASMTLDHAGEPDEIGARVRWFVAEPFLQGSGIGGRLLQELLEFAEESGQRSIYLWTFDGLVAARRLYERVGSVETEQVEDSGWGPTVKAQRMKLRR
jgi:GNAT superfamily N-acetyltransferase